MNPVGHDVNIYDSLFITSYLSGCQYDHQSFLQVIPITPISDEFIELVLVGISTADRSVRGFTATTLGISLVGVG